MEIKYCEELLLPNLIFLKNTEKQRPDYHSVLFPCSLSTLKSECLMTASLRTFANIYTIFHFTLFISTLQYNPKSTVCLRLQMAKANRGERSYTLSVVKPVIINRSITRKWSADSLPWAQPTLCNRPTCRSATDHFRLRYKLTNFVSCTTIP